MTYEQRGDGEGKYTILCDAEITRYNHHAKRGRYPTDTKKRIKYDG